MSIDGKIPRRTRQPILLPDIEDIEGILEYLRDQQTSIDHMYDTLSRAINEGGMTDFMLEVAKGEVSGHLAVNKFGRAPDGIQTTHTDVWDRADATPTQSVWLAPTQARIHQIASTSDVDGKTGAPSSAGARTVRLYGLTSWTTAEVYEDITMDGTTDVATSAYVIIHRMKVLTHGATSVNVGTITATADTDGTVTAQINIGEGQTQMAIYGVPSNKTAYVMQYYMSINKASGADATINASLLVNPHPDDDLISSVVKHTIGVQSTGSSHFAHPFIPPLKITGQAIIHVSGIGSAADLEASAGFDLVLVDN